MQKKFEELSKKIIHGIGSVESVILHTIFFVVIFGLRFFGITTSDILLILTTVVSLEAIYLSIFIQMTINNQSSKLREVSEDIEEIQEDVDKIQEDVDEIEEHMEEIQEESEHRETSGPTK